MTSKKIIFKKAFTLVELLVVISIMGILTVMVSSSFGRVQIKSRDARRKSDLDSVSKALNIYFADNGVFPDTIDLNSGSEFSGVDAAENEIIYIKETPRERSNGLEAYTYTVSSTNKSFKVYANLENEDDGNCIDSCPGYTVSTGCCYGVSSSNIGVTTPLLEML